MTATNSNTPMKKRSVKAAFQFVRLIPFYVMATVLLVIMLWLIPFSYREILPSSILPEKTAPEKALGYLKNLSVEERNDLLEREKNHFRNEPLDRSSLFNLGVLYGLNGEIEKSNALALRSADRSYRDLGAQTAAISLSLSQRNYADALHRMDGLLRSRPEFAKNFFDLMLNTSATPDGLKETSKLLATSPPWRRAFIAFAIQHPQQKSLVYGLFTALRDAKVEVSTSELRLFIDQLFTNKDYETAYFVWLDFLSPAELSKVGLIFDGEFDVATRNLKFGWNLWPVKNSELKTIPKTNVGTDLALNLHFSDLKENFPGVSQYLRLDPGSYLFKGEVKTEQLKTPEGINWRIVCVEASTQIAAGPKLVENTPWKSFEVQFSIPAENCSTQLLYLNWETDAALDHMIDGTINYDNFQINKTSE